MISASSGRRCPLLTSDPPFRPDLKVKLDKSEARKGGLPNRPRRNFGWSVDVSGNWRLTFSFEGEDAVLVDYRDYH